MPGSIDSDKLLDGVVKLKIAYTSEAILLTLVESGLRFVCMCRT